MAIIMATVNVLYTHFHTMCHRSTASEKPHPDLDHHHTGFGLFCSVFAEEKPALLITATALPKNVDFGRVRSIVLRVMINALPVLQLGGIGFVHYNMPLEQQLEAVKSVKQQAAGFEANPIIVSPAQSVKQIQEIKVCMQSCHVFVHVNARLQCCMAWPMWVMKC